jgi:uncharacterized protein (DUF849 family)
VDGVVLTVRMNEYAARSPNPNVPWTPEEIAADAATCVEAGAAVVHFHGRDPETGAPDPSPDTLSRTVGLIGDACDAVTYCTLGAGTGAERDVRLGPLGGDRLPDVAPVDLGSFNLDPYDRESRTFATDEGLYVNTVGTVRHLLDGIVATGVTPSAVAWSIGSLRLLDALLHQGAWPQPVFGDLVVSNRILVTNPATPAGLEALVEFLPPVRATWAVMTAGEPILPMVAPAVETGLGLAFGLGDSPYPELGTPTNADIVRAVVGELERLGRRPATPAEVRAQLPT